MYAMHVGSRESTCGNVGTDVSCKFHHINTAAWVEKNWCAKFNLLNFEARCDLHERSAHRSLWADLHEPTSTVYMQLVTVLEMVCALIKLASGSGSRSSPFLFPRLHNLCTTRCLPFTSAASPTFFTLPKWGDTAVVVRVDGVRLNLWTVASNGPIVHPIDDNKYKEPWWNDTARKNWRTWGKICPSASLSPNPTWTDTGANLSLRSELPAANRLSHGTVKAIRL
jgi:hypothetical protein